MQLWAEKMTVMFAAVLSAGMVCGTAMFSFALPSMNLSYNKAAAVAYVIITMASATFWTLAARSTIGGFALISCIFIAFYLFVGKAEGLPAQGEGFVAVHSATATIALIAAFCVCFSGLMLWLGARKLERFQLTGGASDEDLLTAGPTLMPEALAGWFRCRPSGAFLNLIRKEFRLLRPLWVIELVVVPYLAFLAVFRLLPAPAVPFPETVLEWAILGPPWAACIGLAGLGGILSVGEERRSGTQAWHMTLPISARRQWLVKLVVGMLSGLACSMLLPLLTMIAVGSLFGSPFMYVYLPFVPAWLTVYPILIFACFWCACAANGTVRAAIWVAPATAAIFLASSGGIWLAQELARTSGTLKDFVLSSLHLSPLALTKITDSAREGVLWLFVPAMLLALIQSYRLFRRQPQNSTLWMLRCMMPLVAVTILWSFSAYAGFVSSSWQPFDETRQALDKLHAGAAKLEFTGEDVAKTSHLTPPTQRWLRGSSITVVPERSHLSGYVATIHLASGLRCRLIVTHSGGTAPSCAYERP
jgi:hypothetical protein